MRRLLRLGRALEQPRDNIHDFVIIIAIHYKWWETYPSGESMQLNAVKNDVKAWLGHLDYRHDREDQRRFYFLLDFDLVYTDASGKSQLLPRWGRPTKRVILKTLREATIKGGFGFIYYGGHAHFGAPGTSKIEETQSDCVIYKETEDRRRGAKATYLICCDGKRIYGK
ncbi:hypothetical protein FS837_002149, partial [Tulasnella sp. UAMH 9824]